MTRAVVWSRDALDDLKAQLIYIASDNPDAARRVADALRDAAEGLGQIATGRAGRVVGTYEKSVTRLPYIIVYVISARLGAEVLSIVRVIHTARDWPMGRWPE
ncbi:MAG: plasmid stabilization system [Cypionkella sp.]|uniref:type II toxin-antitoxin system RelE/ParE family toxin n=1 Tax=Cypionkella sp. TaxID=2811411 RepID=UPI0026125C27|nr:type II toxin-antitoxin system RelE/ParE family toxin [Cypionkella sp.]MDB5658693.1 plasmid stabilization system [Cypionkella sp.]MDB5664399.1 plasmid stabilization system [Cypionkella sp.]